MAVGVRMFSLYMNNLDADVGDYERMKVEAEN